MLTGKGNAFGGSAVRTEANGYGCIYFCENMLNEHDREIANQKIAISGIGNVALYAAEKAIEKGASVVTLNDSDGFVEIKQGLTSEQFEFVQDLKENRRSRISEMVEKFSNVEFHKDAKPWGVECTIVMLSATQNELAEEDAEKLIENGVIAVCEGG